MSVPLSKQYRLLIFVVYGDALLVRFYIIHYTQVSLNDRRSTYFIPITYTVLLIDLEKTRNTCAGVERETRMVSHIYVEFCTER